MGEGVSHAIEGKESLLAGFADFPKKGLQRQTFATRQNEIVGVDQVDDLLIAQVAEQKTPGRRPWDGRVFADVRRNPEMTLTLLHQRHGVFPAIEQAHLRSFPRLADDLAQAGFGLASEIEVPQVCLPQEIQLTAKIDMPVLAHCLQNPPFQQRCHQLVNRRFGAADPAGNLIGAHGPGLFLEKIQDIERPVQSTCPALDRVFGHEAHSLGKRQAKSLR